MPPMADADEPDIPQFQVQQPGSASRGQPGLHHARTTNTSYVEQPKGRSQLPHIWYMYRNIAPGQKHI